MVPRIAKRGHSFKGAALYYLHDKEAKTNERVEWTYTHNLPTDDPKKAMGWMAYTAKNADRLKDQAGVVKTGRKSTAGAVYSYSLSWHPEQNPTRETMHDSAMTVLQRLGFSDHEAVFVAHNDTEHPHVHVICNVVHPETGKVVAPSYDYLTTSDWAEKLEKDCGKIYCEQRVINNERRRQEAKQDRQLALIKHREARSERAEMIENLFLQSENGKDFQIAIQQAGYTLSRGDRRGFVLVDDNGKAHSLSRQIKSLKAKEIRERLSDIQDIPQVRDFLTKKQCTDRKSNQSISASPSQVNSNDSQTGLRNYFNALFLTVKSKFDKVRASQVGNEKECDINGYGSHGVQGPKPSDDKKLVSVRESHNSRSDLGIKFDHKKNQSIYVEDKSTFNAELDKWERFADTKRKLLQDMQKGSYNRIELVRKIERIKSKMETSKKTLHDTFNLESKLKSEFQTLQNTLKEIDTSINKENHVLEQKLNLSKPLDASRKETTVSPAKLTEPKRFQDRDDNSNLDRF